MRMDQVLMTAKLRHSVIRSQRHSVTGFRYNVEMETIGDRIRKRRKELGISVEELAKAAELRPTTLYDLERSHSKSSTKLHLIARRLHVDVRWLEVGGAMITIEGGLALGSERGGVRDKPTTIHGYAISSEGPTTSTKCWPRWMRTIRTLLPSCAKAIRSPSFAETRPS